MSDDTALDPKLKTAIGAVCAFGALFALGGFVLWGRAAGVSVAIGAAIAATNLYALARIIRALTTPGASRSVAGWTFALLLKMVFLFGGLWLLLKGGFVTLLPLAAGYMTLPIGIALGNLVSSGETASKSESTKDA